MNFYFIKTPKIIRSFYKNYLWKIDTNEKEIYLTFDDGPTPKVTAFVLETLKNHQAKATFFCVGKNIEANPELFKRIVAEGHSIGNHTQNHLNGWKNNTKKYLKNIEYAQNIIANHKPEIINHKSQTLFRPPYGKIKRSQAKLLISKGYKIVMWSVLSGDFDKKINLDECLKNVLNNIELGSIIVFHDSEKAFKKLEYVLPKIVSHFSNLGFSFKAI